MALTARDCEYRVVVTPKPREYTCDLCGVAHRLPGNGRVPTRCLSCKAAAAATRKATTGTAILSAIREHGPMTPSELRQRLAHLPPSTVKMAASRLAQSGILTKTPVRRKFASTLLYGLGGVEYIERAPLHYDTDTSSEEWTPAPWVHPIRARALGLSRQETR